MFTPLDILYIVLAFCVLWFTAALFWLIWQIANIFKNVNDTVSELRSQVGKIERALTGIKDKFEHSSTSLVGLVQGVTKVVDFMMERKAKGKKQTDPIDVDSE